MKSLALCWMLVPCAYAVQPTFLGIGLTPAQIGQPTRIWAKFAPPTVQGGTVKFTSDGVVLPGCEAVAVAAAVAYCDAVFPKLGTYRIAGVYSGTDFWAAASAQPVTLTVGKLEPWAYIAVFPDAPVYGQGLILQALILGAKDMPNPTGTFTFSEGGVPLVTRPLREDSRAALDMMLDAGLHTITAVYNGDDLYLKSAPKSTTFTITKGTPVVAISSTPAQVGQPTVVTVSVTAPNPTGSVAFEGVPGCWTVPLKGGVASCPATYSQLGDVPVSGAYSGDANLRPAVARMWIPVARAVPGVYLAASPEAPVYGQTVHAGALVLSAPGLPVPTGEVVFSVDGGPSANVGLDGNGRAPLDIALPAGRHTIEAAYAGDSNYVGGQPKPTVVTVAKASPVIAISSTPAQVGQKVTITVTVTALNPTGSVAFEGVPDCASVPLKGGQAQCETAFPKLAEIQVTARYSGDANLRSGDAVIRIAVAKAVAGLYLAADPAAPVFGQKVRVNALTLGAPGLPPPSGDVQFSDGSSFAGTASLDRDGRASIELPLTAGKHTFQAVYNGDGNYLPPQPKTITVTVDKIMPVVAISTTPAQIGQTVVITVSVTAPGPTGSVTFEGVPGCGTVRLDRGMAQCRTAFRQLGDMLARASYSGDDNVLPGYASTRFTVAKAIAGTYLAVEPEKPVYGQPVRLGALVLGAADLPAPMGGVVFLDAGSPVGSAPFDDEGRAAWSSALSVGAHRITAAFTGDLNYARSEASTTVVVARANTTTTLSAPAAGPLTATVAVAAPGNGVPTGTVRFYRDGELIGSAALIATAAGHVATLVRATAGKVTAEYTGDENCNPSLSTAAAVAAKAEVTLTSARNPAAAGQSVAFTAAVTPNPGTAAPTGTVRFSVDGVARKTVAVAAGFAAWSSPLDAGSHTVAAEYSGDAVYPAASASLTQVMSGAQSSFGLSASAASSVHGEPVVFTALLAGGGAGTVRFSDGSAVLGTAPLAGGAASLAVSTLAAGSHTITAAWEGDGTYSAASAEMTYTVAPARTATTLTLGTGAASAHVSALAPGSGTPSGSVRFVNALTKELIGEAALAGGSASFVLPGLAVPVTAVYPGDGNFAGSASAAASPLAVVNAASYEADNVAPDSMASVFGPIAAGIQSANVTDSAGVARQAAVVHSAVGQASIVMPEGLANGPAVVTVGGYSALVNVAPAVPGLFTHDASGKGAPAGLADPIRIGDAGAAVVLYGTGIRHAAGKPLCMIAGQSVDVLYAGPQGEFPGLDQVNIQLSPSLRGAGATLVQLTVDGVAANPVTLTIR